MSSKKTAITTLNSILKLTIPSGGATPSPPVGPALGQKGVKAIDFCRQFNDASGKLYQAQIPLQCQITIKPDRTFTMALRPPATSWLLKRAAGLEKASSEREVSRLPVQFVYEIARIKAQDPLMSHIPLKRIFEMVVASGKAYGITIV